MKIKYYFIDNFPEAADCKQNKTSKNLLLLSVSAEILRVFLCILLNMANQRRLITPFAPRLGNQDSQPNYF